MTGNAAIAYLRVSTAEQAEQGVSLDAQRAAVTAYCAMRRLDLVAVVEDAAVSAGTPLADRPGGAELVGAVARRRVAHVVAFKLDRLFRDAADCLTVTGEWDRRGVALHLVDLGGATVDTSTAMGRFFLTVLAGAAEMERTLIRERTRMALAHKRAKGERVSGEAPFGYRFDGGRVVEDAAEQRTLALVAQLRRDGLSLRKVAAELTRRGVRTRRGTAYSGQGVQGLVAAVGKSGVVK